MGSEEADRVVTPRPSNSTVNGDQSPVSDSLHSSDSEQMSPAEPTLKAPRVPEKGEEKEEKCFTIDIVCPNTEPFKLQVSSLELIHEVHQLLMDREDTCHRTCFSLELDGQTLDNFQDLSSCADVTEGSVLRVVEEPYSMREARLHVRHLHELLHSLDDSAALAGTEGASLTALNSVTGGDITEKKKPLSESSLPPPTLLPGLRLDQPLSSLLPAPAPPILCIKALSYSTWNPPPRNRFLHGDLLYLEVRTLEDKVLYITSSVRGFFLNSSSETTFSSKPLPQSQKLPHHSLSELISSQSAGFKKNLPLLLKRRGARHPYERVPTMTQTYSWIMPPIEHTQDSIRVEEAFPWKLAHDEHIPCQARDWNEEIQTAAELPKESIQQRVQRDRARVKVDADFVQVAVRGAQCVVDGNIMPINPGEKPQNQMFIWNNVFFSLGFDVKEHFKEFGGDEAAFVAPNNDLKGVTAYSAQDIAGLHTLGTVVVDYKGFRVTAQSIIPGILEKEQEQSVVYGSIDFGKTIHGNTKYEELLEPTLNTIKLRPHKVFTEDGEVVSLNSSVDTKGIIGNDQRTYLLDLLSCFPPDLNFRSDTSDKVTLGETARAAGFPRNHPHKLCVLRQELLDSFVESKYVQFVNMAATRIKAELKEGGEEDKGSQSAATKRIISETCITVGSLSPTEFDFSFNPDLFHPIAKGADSPEETAAQQALLTAAATFLLDTQVPAALDELRNFTVIPLDGENLVEHLHRHGINVRYLGYFTTQLATIPSLSYVFELAVAELIVRCAKRIFRHWLQVVEPTHQAAAIAHFLNCFFCIQQPAQLSGEDAKQSRRRGKRSKHHGHNWALYTVDWAQERPLTLWAQVTKMATDYFHYQLECHSFPEAMNRYHCQYVSMLRLICRRLGVQLISADYFLDKQHLHFRDEDVHGLFPLTKAHYNKATDAYSLLGRGHVSMTRGEYRSAYELLTDALNLFNTVYGPLHPDICVCMKLLARISYALNEYGEAMAHQHRLVLMAERVFGLDHAALVPEYCVLALYTLSNGLSSEALRLLYRARYLSLLCHAASHPNIALIDTQIAVLLLGANESDTSMKYLENALALYRLFFGENSEQVALANHLMAKVSAYHGDFKSALQAEGVSYEIYKSKFGQEDERSRDSNQRRHWYTTQAIELKKAVAQKSEATLRLPPLNLPALLEMLNVIHGFQPVTLSPRLVEGADKQLYYVVNGVPLRIRPLEQLKLLSKAAGEGKSVAVEDVKEDASLPPIADVTSAEKPVVDIGLD